MGAEYACVCICVHACKHVHMCTYMHVSACPCICVHACVHVCKNVYMSVCISVCVRMVDYNLMLQSKNIYFVGNSAK